jgi:hypothetical protein
MPSNLEYAQLALAAYPFTEENRVLPPAGWTEIDRINNRLSGFAEPR